MTPTHTYEFPHPEGTVYQDIYDGNDKFNHRLRFGDVVGAWVPYEQFARVCIPCSHENESFHYIMGCQDNWRPLFPPIFEIKIPNKEDVSPRLAEDFQQFHDAMRR